MKLPAGILLGFLALVRVATADDAIVAMRWEHEFTGAQAHANPYRDVTLRVTFAGPGGRHFAGYGFWDGGRTFKVRAAFPVPGEWTWRTDCPADTGLHARAGRVTVAPYAGENPLHRHGPIRVSEDRRHLAHADGTPFFWLGDTVWAAFFQATQPDWETFLDDRAARTFTVVQVHAAKGWTRDPPPGDGVAREAAFEGTGDAFRWNPAYWRAVERKVRAANERGIVVYICAMIEPPWGLGGAPRHDLDAVRLFARQLAARLAGDCVVWSPVADDIVTPAADACGQALKDAVPWQLVIAHPRFLLEPALGFHGRDYTDAGGIQPGTGWTFNPYLKEKRKPFSAELACQAAIEWPLALYHREPRKPVLNLEGVYATANWPGLARDYEGHPAWLSRLPRASAWLSLLSGACGCTYGAGGTWNWGATLSWKQPDPAAAPPMDTVRRAMRNPAADDMRRLHDFFGSIAWWRLEPHHEFILDQPAEWPRRMVLARTAARALAVAYLPDNPAITLDPRALPSPCHARWFHPGTGRFEPATAVSGPHDSRVFSRPAGWEDAVLLLTSTLIPDSHR